MFKIERVNIMEYTYNDILRCILTIPLIHSIAVCAHSRFRIHSDMDVQ